MRRVSILALSAENALVHIHMQAMRPKREMDENRKVSLVKPPVAKPGGPTLHACARRLDAATRAFTLRP